MLYIPKIYFIFLKFKFISISHAGIQNNDDDMIDQFAQNDSK